jgi:cell division protein FtsQ
MSDRRELSRAEMVRARRARRFASEVQQTAQRAVKPIAPVTSRVGTTYVHEKHKRKVEKERRFNIAFGLPHITLHRPTFYAPRLQGRWRMVSAFLVVTLSVAIYLAWTLPYFNVPVATVMGNSRLSREEINAVLGVQGQSIFLVQPDDVATRLRLNYPELASAHVDVYLPNYVFVNVTERQPVIVWQQGEGYTWIDASGVAFRPRGEVSGLITVVGLTTPPAGIPSLDDSLSPPPYMQKDLVDAILALAPSVPDGAILTFDSAEGLGWTDPRGWRVSFGTSAADMPLKVRVYQSLVDSLGARGKVPTYINVTFPEAPYYRMAQTFETTELSLESGQ